MNQLPKTVETSDQMDKYALAKRLRSVLSAAKISLWEFDITNKKCNWWAKPTDHFYKFSQLVNGDLNRYLNLVHPDDRKAVAELVASADVGENFSHQHRILWSDNAYRWIEGTGVTEEENGAIKMVGTVQDITEKKELELERENWKTRHELVTRAAGIIVYDYDIESGDITWSGNVKQVLGYTAVEMGNIDRWVELIHPEDRESAFAQLEIAQERLEPYEVYYRFLKSDTEYCQIYDRGTFLEKDGKAYQLLGMMSDVTEWLESKEALSRSENRFESLMNNLKVGVGLYNVEMIPIVNNEAAYQLLGLSEHQLQGKAAIDKKWNVMDINGNRMNPQDFPIPRAIASKKPVRQVVMGVYRPKMDDRVWLMVDADPVLDQEENILHIVCTYSDFTHRKHVEEALIEKNEQLVISSDLVGRKNERLLEFAQIVSHNLRSPLSSIAALADIYNNYKEKGNEKEKDKALGYIQEVTAKALETIEGLNEVLKVQQSEQVDIQTILFEEALQSVTELLSAVISENGAIVEVDFKAKEIEYPKIYMESIFLNLLSNSIKYGKPGKAPHISISSKKVKKNIAFEFSDNGVGIDLKRNGDDVFTFGKTFHKDKESRGVGLYLVKNQVRTMGDQIELESEPNKGTTFRITFKNQYGK